jgi:hypothetical protein
MLAMPLKPQWSDLYHAYGVAVDTPRHLAALVGTDRRGRAVALDHLFGAVIHHGTPWSATAPVALEVAQLLAGSSLERADRARRGAEAEPDGQPTRAALLDFLGLVGEAADYEVPEQDLLAAAYPADRGDDIDRAAKAIVAGSDEPWGDDVVVSALEARAVLACRQIAPDLFGPVAAQLDQADPRVRMSAANALRPLLRHPKLAPSTRAVRARLLEIADRAGTDERAACMITIGQLGGQPREFLADPHPAVRAAAALAPALADDPAAIREILSALQDPVAVDNWFQLRLPQFSGSLRYALVDAAVSRVADFTALLPAARAVAKVASKHTVDRDWGPLLAAAFPRPLDHTGELTGPQREYLEALVANDELWDRRYGTAAHWFDQAGLPYDREDCARLASWRSPC